MYPSDESGSVSGQMGLTNTTTPGCQRSSDDESLGDWYGKLNLGETEAVVVRRLGAWSELFEGRGLELEVEREVERIKEEEGDGDVGQNWMTDDDNNQHPNADSKEDGGGVVVIRFHIDIVIDIVD